MIRIFVNDGRVERMRQYLFIDFEFTMPDSDEDRAAFVPEIIEAGIVSVVGDAVRDTFSSYVKPVLNPTLTKRCREFLHITQEQVDGGISFETLVEKINAYLKTRPTTIVTWGNSDLHVLQESCGRTPNLSLRDFEALDLAAEYKRFFGGHNTTSLKKAVMEYVGIGFDQRHRALDDALATYEVFKHYQKDRRFLNNAPNMTIGDRLDLTKLFSLLDQ
jgi:sporulation inhibitor KapD